MPQKAPSDARHVCPRDLFGNTRDADRHREVVTLLDRLSNAWFACRCEGTIAAEILADYRRESRHFLESVPRRNRDEFGRARCHGASDGGLRSLPQQRLRRRACGSAAEAGHRRTVKILRRINDLLANRLPSWIS